MTEQQIHLEWWRHDSYGLVDSSGSQLPIGFSSGRVTKNMRIVGSGRKERYLASDFETLYLDFAKLETAFDALDFVRRYGPITHSEFKGEQSDDVDYVLRQAKQVRFLLAHDPEQLTHDRRKIARGAFLSILKNGGLRLGEMVVGLELANDRSGIRMVMSPKSLLDMIGLQLGQALSGHSKAKLCKHCGKFFRAGPGTGRRADSDFCTQEHQREFNRVKIRNSRNKE